VSSITRNSSIDLDDEYIPQKGVLLHIVQL